ncbi:uncharacterized protein [Tursiops truncatus]|uniref:uncharacterized protein isoform X1 n=1 Tax=Tursiops truncatus TaxID=9739 RepID=UPI003CCFBD2A
MLLHAPKNTSLLFSAPSPPSPGSRRGRGTERLPVAPRAAAAGTARGIKCQAQPCPAPGEPPGAALQLRTPRDVRRPDARRAAAAAASPASFLFLLEVFSPTPFAPPPPSSAPSSAYPPRSAPSRSGPRSPARDGACRAPRLLRGNFCTRWWCPLGEGEERNRGTRERRPIRRRRPGAEPVRGGATRVGGGARPPGKQWRALTERGGGAGGAAGSPNREAVAGEPPRRG